MISILAVALGGAIGAVARYAIARIPFLSHHDFPWMTLTANVLGAIIIGVIAGLMLDHPKLTPTQVAFLKSGFCGALTTFSTFSLESFELIQTGKYFIAGSYLVLSIVLCLGGVFLGRFLVTQC